MPKAFILLIIPTGFELVFSFSLDLILYQRWSKQGKVDVLTTLPYYFGASNNEEAAAVVLKQEG